MNERILNLKIQELFLGVTIGDSPQEISQMKVKDFIKKNSFSLQAATTKPAEEYIKAAVKALGEYNLFLEMTDLDEEIFKRNRNSVFLVNRLDQLFKSNPNVYTILRKRGITTLSSLVTLTEDKLTEARNYGLSRVTQMHPSTLQKIKNALNELGLHLGMTKDEVLTLAEEEAKKDKDQLAEDIKNDRANILRMPIEDFLDSLGFDTMRIPYGGPFIPRVHTVEDLVKLDPDTIKVIISRYLKRKTFEYTSDKAFNGDDPECEKYVHSYFDKIWNELLKYGLTVNMENTAIEIYKANPESILLKNIVDVIDEIPDFDDIKRKIKYVQYVYQLARHGDIPQIREFLVSRDIPITGNGEMQLEFAKMKEAKALEEYAKKEKEKKEKDPKNILSTDINKFFNIQELWQDSFGMPVPELKLKHPTNPRKSITTVKDIIALSEDELKAAFMAAMNNQEIKEAIAEGLKKVEAQTLTENRFMELTADTFETQISHVLSEHNLRLGMTKAETTVYSIRPNSRLLDRLSSLLLPSIVDKLQREMPQIVSIARLAATKKEEFNGILTESQVQGLETYLTNIGLKLGMTDAELAAYARKENTNDIVGEIETTLDTITDLAKQAKNAIEAKKILNKLKTFKSNMKDTSKKKKRTSK